MTTLGEIAVGMKTYKNDIIYLLTDEIHWSVAIGTAILAIIGIAILWNQWKIKKQLKQLLEEKERNAND